MLAREEARLPWVRRTRLGREVVPLVCMYITGLLGGGGGGREEAGGGSYVCVCVCVCV
jgi:hypothetical protein